MKTCYVLALRTIFLFSLSLPSWGVLLTLTPATQNASVGDTVQVSVVISGLGSAVAPSLSTYDLSIDFDPLILSFAGAIFGDPILGNQLNLSGFGSVNNATAGIGTVNFFGLSFDDPALLDAQQEDSFTLAKLDFSALQPGTTVLNLSINALGNSMGDPLTASVVPGNVLVGAVPEPGTLLLVMAGLFLTTLFRRTTE